ncbi:MAG TPA: ATPase [Acetivibrio sp.]|jgi:MinD-like ATPase involved in chromosome partitioning or flagellar assembly|nr:ATPase [Clostridium sp.]HQA57484.1 ATPase [Acetivibrio sp.]
MDSTRKLDIIGELGKLSPKEKIFEQLESKKILENVIGFIPACDSADVPILVSNLGVYLGEMGYSICILDANVFYPCIYKLFGCESKPRGRGLLSVLRSDKMDFRDEIIKTKYKNVYLMSSSFMDPIEDYLDIRQQDFERVLLTLKDMFDLVLVSIPNNPPLESCYVSVKNCDMGFIVWSERVDCALNTSKLMTFFSSINIGVAKFSNIIINNSMGLRFDRDIINEMKLKLIAELPFVPAALDHSLEGNVYIAEGTIINKKFRKSLEKLAQLIAN